MRLHEARTTAEWLIALLAPACQQIAVAGGIRREKPEVKDIEILAESLYDHTPNLFGEASNQTSRLDARLRQLFASGEIALDRHLRRNGEKYKRLVVCGLDDAPIDLFIANAANWGNLLAIRTGDADFSRALVTSRVFGGLMPTDMRQKDGMLWQRSQPVECFTEEDFFMHLGVFEIPPPAERNTAAARHLARRWAA